LQIGINLDRETLYKRIDDRVDARFTHGMLEEVEDLIRSGVDIDWLTSLGLEYRIIGTYVMGKMNSDNLEMSLRGTPKQSRSEIAAPPEVSGRLAMTERKSLHLKTCDPDPMSDFDSMSQTLKYKTHSYARRQLTWFRRFPQIKWITSKEEALKLVDGFLKG
jgi:tRNA A37 N6-isopentenylltransferase MiaA